MDRGELWLHDPHIQNQFLGIPGHLLLCSMSSRSDPDVRFFAKKYYHLRTLNTLQCMIIQVLWFIAMVLNAVHWFWGRYIFAPVYRHNDGPSKRPYTAYLKIINAVSVFVTLVSLINALRYFPLI
jgi:hypothetical protein